MFPPPPLDHWVCGDTYITHNRTGFIETQTDAEIITLAGDAMQSLWMKHAAPSLVSRLMTINQQVVHIRHEG